MFCWETKLLLTLILTLCYTLQIVICLFPFLWCMKDIGQKALFLMNNEVLTPLIVLFGSLSITSICIPLIKLVHNEFFFVQILLGVLRFIPFDHKTCQQKGKHYSLISDNSNFVNENIYKHCPCFVSGLHQKCQYHMLTIHLISLFTTSTTGTQLMPYVLI